MITPVLELECNLHSLSINQREESGLPTVQRFDSCTSRPKVCQCLVVQTPMDDMSNDEPGTSMTNVHVAYKAKLCSVVGSSMQHLQETGWKLFGRSVVYYARSVHAFSAGNKCRHCYTSEVYERNL